MPARNILLGVPNIRWGGDSKYFEIMGCEDVKWINVARGYFWWLLFVDTLTRTSGVTGGYPRRIIPHSCAHFVIKLLLFLARSGTDVQISQFLHR